MFKSFFLKNYGFFLLTVIIFQGIAMGISYYQVLLTKPNLIYRIGGTYESFGFGIGLSVWSVFIFIPLFGYLLDRFRNHTFLLMCSLGFIASAATFSIPWASNQITMVVLLILLGVFRPLIVGDQSCVIRYFKDRAPAMNMRNHLGWGIGAFLAGFLLQPFIAQNGSSSSKKWKISRHCELELKRQNRTFFTNSTLNNATSSGKDYGEDRIEYAFMISGFIWLFAAVSLIVLHFLPRPEEFDTNCKKNKEIEIKRERKGSWMPPTDSAAFTGIVNEKKLGYFQRMHPDIISDGNKFKAYSMMICLFLYYLFYILSTQIVQSNINVFAMDPCKPYSVPPNRAALLSSIGQGMLLLSRFVNSFFVNWWPDLFVLIYPSGCLITAILMYTIGYYYEIATWITFLIFEFCTGAIYPIGTAWINGYIKLNSSLIGLGIFGGNCASIIAFNMAGVLIDRYGAPSIFVPTFFFSVLFILNAISVILIGYFNQKSKTIEKS